MLCGHQHSHVRERRLKKGDKQTGRLSERGNRRNAEKEKTERSREKRRQIHRKGKAETMRDRS